MDGTAAAAPLLGGVSTSGRNLVVFHDLTAGDDRERSGDWFIQRA